MEQHIKKLRNIGHTLHPEQLLRDGKMSRGRDRQKLRDALDQSQHDGRQDRHICPSFQDNIDTGSLYHSHLQITTTIYRIM